MIDAIAIVKNQGNTSAARDAAFLAIKKQFAGYYTKLKNKYMRMIQQVCGDYDSYMDEALFDTINEININKDSNTIGYIMHSLRNAALLAVKEYFLEVKHFEKVGEDFFVQSKTSSEYIELEGLVAEMRRKLSSTDNDVLDMMLAGYTRREITRKYPHRYFLNARQRIRNAAKGITC